MRVTRKPGVADRMQPMQKESERAGRGCTQTCGGGIKHRRGALGESSMRVAVAAPSKKQPLEGRGRRAHWDAAAVQGSVRCVHALLPQAIGGLARH